MAGGDVIPVQQLPWIINDGANAMLSVWLTKTYGPPPLLSPMSYERKRKKKAEDAVGYDMKD